MEKDIEENLIAQLNELILILNKIKEQKENSKRINENK